MSYHRILWGLCSGPTDRIKDAAAVAGRRRRRCRDDNDDDDDDVSDSGDDMQQEQGRRRPLVQLSHLTTSRQETRTINCTHQLYLLEIQAVKLLLINCNGMECVCFNTKVEARAGF